VLSRYINIKGSACRVSPSVFVGYARCTFTKESGASRILHSDAPNFLHLPLRKNDFGKSNVRTFEFSIVGQYQ
jgi:hypothetical protein